jgi:hypothetical protein
LLSKHFFEAKISALITLIFAVSPLFVSCSVDIIRDPAYWFFSVIGLYFFTKQIDNRKFLFLLLSSTFFVLATSIRIEAILFILVSGLYIILIPQQDRLKKFIVFSTPLVLILFFFVIGQMILRPSGEFYWYRLQEVLGRLSGSINSYQQLEGNLSELIRNPPMGIQFEFFYHIRTLIWFIGLGAILQNAIEAFHYPFFLIFIIGLQGMWKRAKEDRSILYFTLLSFAAPILLYFYVFTTWSIEHRYFVLMIFPSFIFLGFGLEKIIHFLKSRYHLKEHLSVSIICLFILAFALPNDMAPKEVDKVIFKRIGEIIAEREGRSHEIEVLTLGDQTRWISFYANYHVKGAPCPDKYYYDDTHTYRRDNYKNIIGNSYEQFVYNLKSRGIKYLLWEEHRWPPQRFDFLNRKDSKQFIKIGSWEHQDTGKLILFEVL